MEVDIVLSGLEIGDLRVGQNHGALYWAREVAGERYDDPRVRPASRRTVDMSPCHGTAEARIVHRPGQRLGGGVQDRRRSTLARGGKRRNLVGAAEIRLERDLVGPSIPPDQKHGEDTKTSPQCTTHISPSLRVV